MDPVKEAERLGKKQTQLNGALEKLQAQMTLPDYMTKVGSDYNTPSPTRQGLIVT